MDKLTPRMKMALKWLGWVLLLVGFIALFFTRLLKYIAPFIMAFIIMVSMEGLVVFFQKRVKLPRSPAVALSLLILIVVVGGGLVFVFYKIIVELWRLAMELPRLDFNPLIEYFENLFEKGQDLFFRLPKGLADTIEQSLELDVSKLSKITGEISSRLMGLVMGMIDFLKFLPEVIVFIIVMLVSTYFMSRDRNKISLFLSDRIPENWISKGRNLKNDMIMALAGFLKAQLFLMLITFVELFIGFQIIGIKYPFFFALVTAVVDVLPVLGTGTILIPGAIIYFIIGNIPRGVGFLTLYFIIFIVRQVLEPKIVSESLGIHPLVTLISMYIGLKLLGVGGMILGPIIAIVLKGFYRADFFPSWRMPK